MKSFKELRKIIEAAEVVDPLPEIAPPGTAVPTEVLEAYKEVVVDWDQDRPDRELAGDIKDEFGVYVDGYNKRKGTLTVSGSEKDLIAWLSDNGDIGMGIQKNDAQSMVKKGKNVKESVDEALVEENANHRGKQKIAKDGTVLNIPGKKGGLTAYNIKPRLSGGKLEFFTTDNEGAIKVMSVQELAKVLK